MSQSENAKKKYEVVGLDLSLTATGVASNDQHFVIKCGFTGMERIHYIWEQIEPVLSDATKLVVVEGYAFNAHQGAHFLGELGGIIRYHLWRRGLRWIDIPPPTLKVYATGSGSASKFDVLAEAVRRLKYEASDHNVADAMWLHAFGCDLLDQPVIKLPANHRRALEKYLLSEGYE